MRREQLEHAIRAACQIIGQPEVIVVGSQAILGTYDESRLPAAATMSIEVDVPPIADSNEATARLADLIEGIAGELSPFEERLRHRRRRPRDRDTPRRLARSTDQGAEREHGSPSSEPRFAGLCLDKEDLCVSKLVAFREKDRNFVAALLQADLVDPDLIASRLQTIPPEHVVAGEAAIRWLSA